MCVPAVKIFENFLKQWYVQTNFEYAIKISFLIPHIRMLIYSIQIYFLFSLDCSLCTGSNTNSAKKN